MHVTFLTSYSISLLMLTSPVVKIFRSFQSDNVASYDTYNFSWFCEKPSQLNINPIYALETKIAKNLFFPAFTNRTAKSLISIPCFRRIQDLNVSMCL